MKTKYNYIHFTCIGDTKKTTRWSINNNCTDAFLGEIKWYSAWRTYCFFTASDTVFNVDCLEDIQNFINQLQTNRKKNSGFFQAI
jgi:hypothetical protein